jgi:hypothetical protein
MPDTLGYGGHAPNPQDRIALGRVSTRQPAPSTFADPLFVVFDSDPDHAIKFTEWPRLHGATLPALGAPVLVVTDDQDGAWVLLWSGANS